MSALDLAADDLARVLAGANFLVRLDTDGAALFLGGSTPSSMHEVLHVADLPSLAAAATRSPLVAAALGVNEALSPYCPVGAIAVAVDEVSPASGNSDDILPVPGSLLPLVDCSCTDGCTGCWWTGQAVEFPLALCGEGVHTVLWLDDSLPVELTALSGHPDRFSASVTLDLPVGLWGAGSGLFNGDGELSVLELGPVSSRGAAIDRARDLIVQGLGFVPDAVTCDAEGRVVSATLYAHQAFPAEMALAALLRTANDLDASVLLEPAGIGLDGSGWRVSLGLAGGGVVPLAEAWDLSAALSVALRPDALDLGL
jgi:hypothetical protein